MSDSFNWGRLDDRDGTTPRSSPYRAPAAQPFTPKQFSSLIGSSVSVAIFFAMPVALLAHVDYLAALLFVGTGCFAAALVIGALWAAGSGRAGSACRALGNVLYGLLCVCGVIGLITFVVVWLLVHTAPQQPTTYPDYIPPARVH